MPLKTDKGHVHWKAEVKKFKQSFIKAGYLAKFVNKVIRVFEKAKSDETVW